MEAKEAIDFIPYDEIGADYVVSALGDVSFAFECRTVEAYTMANVVNEGENIDPVDSVMFYHNWKLALNKLPDGTVVQKYNFIYTIPYEEDLDSDSITKKWNEKHYSKRDIVLDKVYIVVSFKTAKSNKNPIRKSLINRVNSMNASVQLINDAREKFIEFHKMLKDSFEYINVINGEGILDLFIDLWNQEYNSNKNLKDLSVKQTGIAVGEEYVTILSSRSKSDVVYAFTSSNRGVVPTEEIGNNTHYYKDGNLPVSYLFPIGIGMPVNHILVETIELCDKEVVESELTKEFKGLNPLAGMKNLDALNKRKQINEMKELRSDNQYRYAKWGVTVFVSGITEEISKTNAKIIRDTALRSLGMNMSIENFGAWRSFYYSMPGMGKLLENLRLDYLETLSYLTHVETFKKGNSNGIILVDQFGKPFKQDFWKNKHLTAVNGLVFGPTGQGKSVAVNHMLDQCYWNGDVIFILDVGGSYRRVTKLNNGLYIDSDNISNLKFNPFLECFSKNDKYYPDLDSAGEKDPIYLDYIVSLILSCWYLDEPSIAKEVPMVLKGLVKEYFLSYNNGTIKKLNFDSFYSFIVNFDFDDKEVKYFDKSSFKLMLREYLSEGQYGFLLNAEFPLDANNRWVAFDLKGVNNSIELAAPVTIMIMQMFQRKLVENKGSRIRFWIDEAIDFLKSEGMADYIGSAYRKIRKEGGQIVIITQSIDYLDVLPEITKSSILSNTDIKILLNHKGKEAYFDKIQRDLGLTSDEMELLNNQTPYDGDKYRLVFIKYGTQKGYLARIEISKETFSLYQTNAEDVKLIDELIERYGGNVEMAASEFVELKEK